VRSAETGIYDRYVVGKVAAVITWTIPAQLQRVTGDGSWLWQSPRYVLQAGGGVRYTGSFLKHRLLDPIDGAAYLARSQFASIARADAPARESEQSELFVALVKRLKELVRQRYGAPLVVVDQFPEVVTPDQYDLQYLPTFESMRDLGMPIVSVRQLMGPSVNWPPYFYSFDGHPRAALDGMIARALKHKLEP